MSKDATDIHLCPATFIDLSADQERHAVEALAELLVPLLTDPHRVPSSFSCDPEPGSDLLTEPTVQTRPALLSSAAEQGPPLLPE